MRFAVLVLACLAVAALASPLSFSKYKNRPKPQARALEADVTQMCRNAMESVSACYDTYGAVPDQDDFPATVRAGCCSNVATLVTQCAGGDAGNLTLAVTGIVGLGDASTVAGLRQIERAMNLIAECPRDGTTPEGCTGAISSVNTCIAAAGMQGDCCFKLETERDQCFGQSTGTSEENNTTDFFQTFMNHTMTTGCHSLPFAMCQGAATSLNTCTNTAFQGTFNVTNCCSLKNFASFMCMQYHNETAPYLATMPYSFDQLDAACDEHGGNNNNGTNNNCTDGNCGCPNGNCGCPNGNCGCPNGNCGNPNCDWSRVAQGISWFSDMNGGFPITNNPAFADLNQVVYQDNNMGGQMWWRVSNDMVPAAKYNQLQPRDPTCSTTAAMP